MSVTNRVLRKRIADKFRQLRGGVPVLQFLQEKKLKAPKWNRYENDAETPSLEKAVEICECLDISPTWLLLDKGPPRLEYCKAKWTEKILDKS
jgi:transcriptional regulator with XRE-family HTH domain